MMLKMTNSDFEAANRMFETMDIEVFHKWLYKKIEVSLKEKQETEIKKMFAEM